MIIALLKVKILCNGGKGGKGRRKGGRREGPEGGTIVPEPNETTNARNVRLFQWFGMACILYL